MYFENGLYNLYIETGRHKNKRRNKRFCKTCITEIEDEYYFILVCPMYMYLALRSKLRKKYYGVNRPCTN